MLVVLVAHDKWFDRLKGFSHVPDLPPRHLQQSNDQRPADIWGMKQRAHSYRLTLWNHVEWHRVRSVTTVAKAGDDISLSDFSSFKTLSYWFMSLVSTFSHLRIHLLARAASKDVRLQPGEVDDPQKLSWIASPQSRRSPEQNFISKWEPRWRTMKIDYLKHDFMNERRFRAPKVQSP